jgi:hypothetical protein
MHIENVRDDRPDNSDKLFLVPEDEEWRLLWANVVLVTSADAGDRQIRFSVLDPSGDEVGYISAGTVQAASLTRNYGFMQGIYRETSFSDGMIQVPITLELHLPPGSIMRFYDSKGIAPEADNMTVTFQIEKLAA